MKSKKLHMSHGDAQWCQRANTMDNLRTLNRQKVTYVICDFINVVY